MITDDTAADTEYEPPHTEGATAHLLAELQLFGHRRFEDDPDPRPLPEERLLKAAVFDAADGMAAALNDTRLEPDLEGLVWMAPALQGVM